MQNSCEVLFYQSTTCRVFQAEGLYQLVYSMHAGAWFSSASSRGSSMGSFLLLKKLYRTAFATNIVRVVESFILIDIERQGNNLFQIPNILSIVFLVRIWDALYLRSYPAGSGFRAEEKPLRANERPSIEHARRSRDGKSLIWLHFL